MITLYIRTVFASFLVALVASGCVITKFKGAVGPVIVEFDKAEMGSNVGSDINDIAKTVCAAPRPVKDAIIAKAKAVCESWRGMRQSYMQGLAAGAFPSNATGSIQGLVDMYTALIKKCDEATAFVEACEGVRSPGNPPREETPIEETAP